MRLGIPAQIRSTKVFHSTKLQELNNLKDAEIYFCTGQLLLEQLSPRTESYCWNNGNKFWNFFGMENTSAWKCDAQIFCF